MSAACRRVGTAPDKVVWRFGRRFAPRHELLRVVAEKSDDSFVAVRVAAEDALGFERLQIEAIEEWAIAFG